MHPLADAVKDFVEGRVAMLGRTYFNLKTNDLLPKVGDAFRWESAMMPRHPKTGRRGGMFSGDAHAIARTSGAPDAAFELLKWLTDREFGIALGLQSKGSTTLGGRPDVYADERILNHPQLSRQTQRAQLKSVSEIKEPFTASHNYRNPEVEQARDAGTAKIANGEQKAEPGYLRSLNGELQAILARPRP
jgi:ABC-type glycerol-3-phosphate transport system substrate-binding protein